MVVISDVGGAPAGAAVLRHRVLGGFTTFSTYAVDVQKLVAGGQARAGLAYLALTVVAALVAVWTAVWVTRRVLERRQR